MEYSSDAYIFATYIPILSALSVHGLLKLKTHPSFNQAVQPPVSQSVSIVSMELTVSAGHPLRKGESDDLAQVSVKVSSTGLTLIPQPSNDVKDPLVCNEVKYSASDYPKGLLTTHNI